MIVGNAIYPAAEAVLRIDEQLRAKFKDHPKKLWEHTHVYYQQKRRAQGGSFDITDHIRAMVYAMISSSISWARVEDSVDLETGRFLSIDEAFCQYDPKQLRKCSPEYLRDRIKEIGGASQSTLKQMKALLNKNIPKLIEMESIEKHYQRFLAEDPTGKTLVRTLSRSGSPNKMVQLGEALAAEYLRNVGHDIAKPDRHITQILGRDWLGCSDRQPVPPFEAMDIVAKIAAVLNRPVAETDYILWSFCAKGYGEGNKDDLRAITEEVKS